MKAWNKPIRLHYSRTTMIETENEVRLLNPWKEEWGITNWIVGTCHDIWAPWIQISLGKITIQIKWYVVIGLAIIGSFIGGMSIGH